jgi:hypothetical protein
MKLRLTAGEAAVDRHQKRLGGGLEGVSRNATAAVELAFVLKFHGDLCLGIFPDRHGLHAEVSAAGGYSGGLLDRKKIPSIGPSPAETSATFSSPSPSPRPCRSRSVTRGESPLVQLMS